MSIESVYPRSKIIDGSKVHPFLINRKYRWSKPNKILTNIQITPNKITQIIFIRKY